MVVSDYRPGQSKSWNDLRATLAALALQDFEEPVEYLLLETDENLARMPADVTAALPGVRVVASAAPGSYEMKNAGVQQARASLVGVLDADCVPAPGWVRAAVAAMRRWPDAAAVSGRTTYPGRSTLERALGLLSRCYVDRGTAGPARLLSTNNMMVRRERFTADPLPTSAGPFAYRLMTERLVRQGGTPFYFDPAMRAVHDFEGWPMERDLRRQVGWTSIRIRQLDAALPGAQVIRALGLAAVPLLYGYRLMESAGHCVRLPRYFGLGRRHVPMLLALAAIVHACEIPGMLAAFQGESAGPTVYR
jgi:hypothetical protein